MVAQDDPELLSVADLNVAEQFVLWAVRTRLEGRNQTRASRAASDWRMIFRAAAPGARRSNRGSKFWRRIAGAISTSTAPCPCLSAERTMLDLVASSQLDDEGVCIEPRRAWFIRGRSGFCSSPVGPSPPP